MRIPRGSRRSGTLEGMRTTLDIDDDLIEQARICAARERKALEVVVGEVLRQRLAANSESGPGPAPQVERREAGKVTLPTWDGGGVPADLDLASNAATRAWMDTHHDEAR